MIHLHPFGKGNAGHVSSSSSSSSTTSNSSSTATTSNTSLTTNKSNLSRTTSDNTSGLAPLKPMQSVAPSTTATSVSSLSFRRPLQPTTSTTTSLTPLTPAALLLLEPRQTVSQPPLSRAHNNISSASSTVTATPSTQLNVSATAPSSRSSTPLGFNTPLPNQSSSHHHRHHEHHHHVAHVAGAGLEESYVGKISLKLGEAVNKIFLPHHSHPQHHQHHAGHHAHVGHAMTIPIVVNGSHAPSVLRSRDLADVLVAELHAAIHDPYLLRTLLRSSVLKSLSLFLTRLTALLILPLVIPTLSPVTLKDFDTLPASFRFNLQIVRCAFEVKEGLRRAGSGKGVPRFVAEGLKGWLTKLDQVMARIMDPIVLGIRSNIIECCRRGRTLEVSTLASVSALGYAAGAGSMIGGLAASTTQRSLSLGRSLSSIASSSSTTTSSSLLPSPTPVISSLIVADAGSPTWLKDLANSLECTNLLLARIDCRREADKWRASIGTCAVWKGCLTLAARPLALSSTVSANAFNRLSVELESFESLLLAFNATLSPSTPGSTQHAPMTSSSCPSGSCILCRTGRTFDIDSSSSSDDSDSETEEGGRHGGLASCAMREAMQVVSSLIVVVKASALPQGCLLQALLSNSGSSFVSPANSNSTTALTVRCPTLSHALDTLPTLLLLHLLISRLPTTVPFRMPHELWSLEWTAYERELKGFAAAEEWTDEIGEEVGMECARVERLMIDSRRTGGDELAREALRVLKVAVRVKCGIDVE